MPLQGYEHLKPALHSFNGPVSALALWAQKAVVGCGNEVSIYCLTSLHMETRVQVLHGACIHGFCQGSLSDEGSQLMCVYGAKQARVITLKTNEDNKTDIAVLTDIVHCPDWIWEACWVKYKESANTIAIALAHNSVVLWKWDAKEIIQHQECAEKCILYCAHFIGGTWTDLVLAAGTVFNQVVLWLVSPCNENAQEITKSPAPVMHTLSGHKGVIFSIKYHTQHQRLCSVSDDRGIRMWQLDFPNGKTTTPCADDWRAMQSTLLLSVFGHSARVFDAVLMNDYFASVGEDATCCIWDYCGQVIAKFKGHKGKCIWSVTTTKDEQYLLTGGGDGSVRMWKIKATQDSTQDQRVLDVSNTFLLEKDDFPRTVTLLDYDKVLIMMNSGSLYCYSMSLCQFGCVFKDARFISYSVVTPCPDKVKIAVASIEGTIRILKLSSDFDGRFHDVPFFEESLFDNKVLAVVWLSHDSLIVSGQNGICHLLKIVEETNANISHGLKVERECSLFLPVAKHRWVSAACFVDSPPGSTMLSATKLLACGDKDGTVYSYLLPAECGTSCDVIQPNQSFHRIHGKNGVTHISFQDEVLYSVGRDGCCRHWGVENGQLLLRHGSKVVKGFEWIERLEMNSGDLMFYGFFSTQFVIWSQRYNQKMFYAECGGGHRSWGCCHENGAFRFAYLKGGLVNVVDSAQCSKHEILKGHNVSESLLMLKQKCFGSVHLKMSQSSLFTHFSDRAFKPLKPPLHGRELHDVKLLGIANTQSPKSFFLTFTASEDTTINIGSYNSVNGFMQWKPLATLKGHLSSVRTLALLCEPGRAAEGPSLCINPVKRMHASNNVCRFQKDFILFTGGGRAEIRVWKVQVNDCLANDIVCSIPGDNFRGNEFEENSHLKTEKERYKGERSVDACGNGNTIVCTHQEWSTHYLGESRHKRPFSKWKTRKLHLDPETRVMSLDATSVCDIGNITDFCDVVQDLNASENEIIFPLEHLHIVSAAGSDGLLRVFCYNTQTRKLFLIAQSAFHQGCVLKVLHFQFESKQNNLFLSLSASTNGKVAIWLMDDIVRRSLVTQKEARMPKQPTTHEKCEGLKTSSGYEETLRSKHATVDGEHLKGIDEDHADKENENDRPEEFHPVCSLPAHQSGINSIHALQVNDTTFLLASGGDDNALTVQVIEVKGREVKVNCHETNRSAHCAQITGLRLVSDRILVSGSIDQRICVWGLDISSDRIKIDLLSCSYIYLADVSCMDVCIYRNEVYLCLGGEGLCLYSMKKDQSIDEEKSIK